MEDFIHNDTYAFAKLGIVITLASLDLISELVWVGVVDFLFYLLAAHAWEKDFLLGEVYVFVGLYCLPDVLHVFWHVVYGDIVFYKVFVFCASHEEGF